MDPHSTLPFNYDTLKNPLVTIYQYLFITNNEHKLPHPIPPRCCYLKIPLNAIVHLSMPGLHFSSESFQVSYPLRPNESILTFHRLL